MATSTVSTSTDDLIQDGTFDDEEGQESPAITAAASVVDDPERVPLLPAAPGASGTTVAEKKQDSGFGEKNISFFGSLSLLANNITGPGMILVPMVYQQSGWLGCTLLYIIVCIGGSLSANFFIVSMQCIPGNARFAKRVEFLNVVRRLFPKWGFWFAFLIFVFNMQVSNISGIVESSQTMDNSFVHIFGGTCALVIFDPHSVNGTHFSPGFHCAKIPNEADSPFGNAYVISVGFLFVLAIALPLGYYNLDDNMWVQEIGFIMLVIIIFSWCASFIVRGLHPELVPLNGNDWSNTISNIFFNYGFVVTVPSWINEKKPHVDASKAVWVSTMFSTLLYVMIGFLCGMGIPFPNNMDILSALNDPMISRIDIWARICSWLFPLAALVTSIPIFSIIIRYNLLENKVCNKFFANMFAVILPWVIALFFYAGNFLTTLLAWSGAFVFVLLNFVFPVICFILLVERRSQFPYLQHFRSRVDTFHVDRRTAAPPRSFLQLAFPGKFGFATVPQRSIQSEDSDSSASVVGIRHRTGNSQRRSLFKRRLLESAVLAEPENDSSSSDAIDASTISAFPGEYVDGCSQTPIQSQVTALPGWLKHLQYRYLRWRRSRNPNFCPHLNLDADPNHVSAWRLDDDYLLEKLVAWNVLIGSVFLNIAAVAFLVYDAVE